MSAAGIDINDAGIVVACDGLIEPPIPGYALLRAGTIAVGEAVRRVARIEPLNVDNRFWHELDERPLSQPAAAGRSRADLAYAQLNAIWAGLNGRVQTVACAVPGSLRPAQLALILGIARECGMPLGGFIDSAVAAATAWDGRGRFIYIDVHLHQAIATAVEVGAQARRERIEIVPRAGLLALHDSWMQLVARTFITRTRLDPLLQANTEQALFVALSSWLERLGEQAEIEAEVAFGDERHRVPLTREEFLLASAPLYSQIALSVHRLRRAGHPLTLALSAGAAALPGLAESFAEFHDCEVLACVPGCAALAAAAHAETWSVAEDAATLFCAAPPLSAERADRIAPVKIRSALGTTDSVAPTHVLYQGRAHALSAHPLIMGLAPGAGAHRLQLSGAIAGISRLHCSLLRTAEGAAVIDYSRYGTWLNDERVAGRAPLRAGDRLRLGAPGITLDLIAID